jgi:hypothetical protein
MERAFMVCLLEQQRAIMRYLAGTAAGRCGRAGSEILIEERRDSR